MKFFMKNLFISIVRGLSAKIEQKLSEKKISIFVKNGLWVYEWTFSGWLFFFISFFFEGFQTLSKSFSCLCAKNVSKLSNLQSLCTEQITEEFKL